MKPESKITRKASVLTGPFLFLCAGFLTLLTSCDHTLGVTRELIDPLYTVKTASAENGSIRVLPVSGLAGSQVLVAANPAPGYRLASLKRAEAGNPPQLDGNLQYPPYRFRLSGDNTIYAEFETVPSNNYTASMEKTIIGGSIIAYAQTQDAQGIKLQAPYGNPTRGVQIVLQFYPDEGFVLRDGSVKYTELDSQNNRTANVVVLSPPYSFTLPAAHVIIDADFDSPDAAGFIASGKAALRRDDYDSAVIAFETAYKMDPDNREAVFYSTLGNLASIAVDTKVRQLLSSVGLGNYPGNLNNLLTLGDSWDNYYTDSTYTSTGRRPGWLNDYSGVRLPDHTFPGGYYAFQNQTEIMQASLKSGAPTMATYQLIMFFNLMGSNIRDINNVVDDALRYVFGDKFEAAAARAAKLSNSDSIVLETDIIEKLFLSDIFKHGDTVGKAELGIILASFRIFKAGLEWVAAYDLDFDRSLFRIWSFNAVNYGTFFPHFPGLFDALNEPYVTPDQLDGDGATKTALINDLLGFLLRETDKYFIQNPLEASRIPDMFPLRNHFLKERAKAQESMDKSRAELLKALETLSGVYDHYFDDPNIPFIVRNELNNYRWVKDGLAQLQNAIKNDGTFYFPEDLPKGAASWSYTDANAKYGINFGKLFTPGQFSPDKLIVTEPGGKRPKFYGWGSDTSGDGSYISQWEDVATYDWIGFKLNLIFLKQVFVKGLEKDGRVFNDTENVQTLFPDIVLTPDNGNYLYTFYYDLFRYLKR
ncbi:MAG: hypothetical protein LBT16_10720 [Treponema sp.]|jgi:hypothetical protein|nr:hypothetical protein [Treponema sp.]